MLNPQQAKSALRRFFQKNLVAKLDVLMQTIQARSHMSVFRRLKELGYRSSYTHAGRYYTLKDIPRFDACGLWRCGEAGFSRAGTLKSSVADIVASSPAGRTPRELQDILRVRVNNALLDLARARKIRREPGAGERSLYVSGDEARASEQIARRLQGGATEGQPPSDLVIKVLMELLDGTTVDATPAEVAQRLHVRGVGATTDQVRQVFERYKLGRKKGVRSPRLRR